MSMTSHDERERTISRWCHRGQRLPFLRSPHWPSRVVLHRHVHWGMVDIRVKCVKEVVARMNLQPPTHSVWPGPMIQKWNASAVAITLEKPFGGGRDALGNATLLHQNIVASSLPGTVYIFTPSHSKASPGFRKIVQPRPAIDITFCSRAALIDGSGQVCEDCKTTCFKLWHGQY